MASDVANLVSSWLEIVTMEDGEDFIKGENDTFHLEDPDTRWSMSAMKAALSGAENEPSDEDAEFGDRIIDYNKVIKRLASHKDGLPSTKETPYFNHNAFYANLKQYNSNLLSDPNAFGRTLLYGEVVTSTSTMLERNPIWLKLLPTGFTFTATTQVAGRGRGSNVWVSPPGSLMFSTVIRHSMSLAQSAPVVFIQYLAALAVVSGIASYDRGYSVVPVKLKWPNDIYALDPQSEEGKPSYVKIGGILVNSSYSGGDYTLVVGIGINVTNAAPTTGLNVLASRVKLPPFQPEKLLARILTSFEWIYAQFCRTGWDRNLESMYYKNWLHNEQVVTLEAEGGVKARIKGITREFGLLLAEELGWEDRPTGKMWQLQSDSNRFDFFKGLVKRKV
jgi:biotin--protein ligase